MPVFRLNAVVAMYENEGVSFVSPPLVTSGRSDPWVVEEVVWEEMAANGGCGWIWEGAGLLCSLCDIWSFSLLLSLFLY